MSGKKGFPLLLCLSLALMHAFSTLLAAHFYKSGDDDAAAATACHLLVALCASELIFIYSNGKHFSNGRKIV